MSNKRKGLVGQGYMPKGGVAAAKASNARVRAAEARPAAEPATPPAAEPLPHEGRTDGRGSDRSAGSRSARLPDGWKVVAASVAASTVTTGVLSWLGG